MHKNVSNFDELQPAMEAFFSNATLLKPLAALPFGDFPSISRWIRLLLLSSLSLVRLCHTHSCLPRSGALVHIGSCSGADPLSLLQSR